MIEELVTDEEPFAWKLKILDFKHCEILSIFNCAYGLGLIHTVSCKVSLQPFKSVITKVAIFLPLDWYTTESGLLELNTAGVTSVELAFPSSNQ